MQNQKHTKWECTYHVVIVPKYRKKRLYKAIRNRLRELIPELCRQKGVEVLKGNVKPDHVHMLLSIPPKLSVSQVMGFLKGKLAIRLHNEFGKGKMISGKSFWSRGYFVRSSGLDKDQLRKYIQDQWNGDRRDEGSNLDYNW